MLNEFSRTELLLGPTALNALQNCRVAVFGIGGVGTFAVEGLARSGVGKFLLVDDDRICLTNLNRQIHATHDTIGRVKVEVMRERILAINPRAEVEVLQKFYVADESVFQKKNASRQLPSWPSLDSTPQSVSSTSDASRTQPQSHPYSPPDLVQPSANLSTHSSSHPSFHPATPAVPLAQALTWVEVLAFHQTPGQHLDYIIDAIDTVTAKLDLIVHATQAAIPVISCMGAGNKLDPTRLEVADIYTTSVCPLARVMRQELRRRGVKSLKVVYSREEPLKPRENDANSCRYQCVCPKGTTRTCIIRHTVPGSVAFVPSVAGMILAGEVIKDLIGFTASQMP